MRSPRPWTVLVLSLAVVVLAAHGPVIVGGRTWSDPSYMTEVQPAQLATVDAIAAGRMPGWWERAGLGAPLAAEPAHGATYPPTWMAAAAPSRAAWLLDLVAALHVVWAGLGVALLARRLGADALGAMVAGALIAASDVATGAIVGGGIGALAHVAWAAWAADGIARALSARARLGGFAALAAATAAMVLAGRWTIAADAIVLATVLAIARARRRRDLAWVGGGVLLGVGIAAFALVPAVLHLAGEVSSTGGPRDASGWALVELVLPHARRLGEGGGPGTFLGGAAVLFAVVAIARGGDGRRALGACAALLALGGAGLLAPWDWLVGVDRAASHPAEHLAVAAIALAALGGVGFSELASRGAEPEATIGTTIDRRLLTILGAAAGVLVIAVVGLAVARPTLARALAGADLSLDDAVARVDGVLAHAALAVAIAVAALALVVSAARRRWPPAVPVAGLLALGHAVILGRLAHPQVPRDTFTTPPALVEAARRADGADADARAALAATGLSPRVYRPERMDGALDTAAAHHQTLAAAAATRFGLAAARWAAPGRRRVEDALWSASATAGARLFDRYAIDLAIVPRSVAVPADLPVLGERAGWVLVATRARRPRAFLASAWRWFPDDAAAIAALFPQPGVEGVPLGAVARRGAGTDSPPGPTSAPRACDVRAEAPERVVVHCEGAGVIALLDAWAPGWSVTVDGAPARLERVDVAARGVEVGPGAHVAVFSYAPPGRGAGMLLTLASLVALGGILGLGLLRSRR